MDPQKSIYHLFKRGSFSYQTKLRPFCAEFLLEALSKFEIHFNTAATRLYGTLVL